MAAKLSLDSGARRELKIQPQINQPSREAVAGKLQIYADAERRVAGTFFGGARLLSVPKSLTEALVLLVLKFDAGRLARRAGVHRVL
jgi:hypothetical protein